MYQTDQVVDDAFARALRTAMAKKGLDALELSRRAAVHSPRKMFDAEDIRRYLAGRALPLPGELLALAQALGTAPDRLLEGGMDRAILELRKIGSGKVELRLSARVPLETARAIAGLLRAET
jgi:transcriptional regulator with XRE-family HTH domain